MRRMAIALVAAGALLGPAPAGAQARTQEVRALFLDFTPSALDVLPGETVEWNNVGGREHDVRADDGSFESGELAAGSRFAHTFETVGEFGYHCAIHPGMRGEVDVRRVTLGTLGTAAVPAGDPVQFDGRTADPGAPVTIERDTGAGFRPVTTVAAEPDGSWKTTLTAQATADYRAVAGLDASETRRLLVSDRKVLVRATRRGIAVKVHPAAPYARIQLQLDLRERFGWWPQRLLRLDYLSGASIRVARPARVRVALVDRDGWAPLAVSEVVELGRATRKRPPRRAPRPHGH